jgi:AcrR family transcriptional regulator
MPSTKSALARARGRRLSPEARREHILEAARDLFAERPFTVVTTADVAEAAGVARSLVHHYFGGIGEVFAAVVAQGGAALSDVRTAGTETPFEERLAYNVAASLDVIEANRETWLAVAGHGEALGDPQIRALVDAARRRHIERTLAANRDVIRDTPVARHALRCFNAFLTEATRAWLIGAMTRAQTEALMLSASRDLFLRTIPELQSAEAPVTRR